MARKHRLKKTADNPFTKITGRPVIKLTGSSSCHIIEGRTTAIKGLVNTSTPTKRVAAYLYLTHPSILSDYGYPSLIDGVNEYSIEITDFEKVTQTCGVDQCVNPEHLLIKLKPAPGWQV